MSPQLLKYQGIALTCTHDAKLQREQITGSVGDICLLEYSQKLGLDYQIERINYVYLAKYPKSDKRVSSGIILKIGDKNLYFGKIECREPILPPSIS